MGRKGAQGPRNWSPKDRGAIKESKAEKVEEARSLDLNPQIIIQPSPEKEKRPIKSQQKSLN